MHLRTSSTGACAATPNSNCIQTANSLSVSSHPFTAFHHKHLFASGMLLFAGEQQHPDFHSAGSTALHPPLPECPKCEQAAWGGISRTLAELESLRQGREILSPPCEAHKGEIKGVFIHSDPLPQKTRRPPWKRGTNAETPAAGCKACATWRRFATKLVSRG